MIILKKHLIKSLSISGVLTLFFFIINLISAYLFHHLPLAITLSGGEYIGEQGFGVLLEKIYPMSIVGEESGVSEHISFDFYSLIVSFIVLFIAVLIFCIIESKIKKNKK